MKMERFEEAAYKDEYKVKWKTFLFIRLCKLTVTIEFEIYIPKCCLAVCVDFCGVSGMSCLTQTELNR